MPAASRSQTSGRSGRDAVLLPPGPRHGRLAGTVAFHRDPLGYLRRAQARFGDVFTLRLATGTQVVLADPALAGEVAASDPQSASAGSARRAILPMASARSVFGGDGDEHAAARSRLADAFTREAARSHEPAIAAIAARHMARWPRRRPFRLLSRMRLLADEVFVRLVLGVNDDARAEVLARAIARMLMTPGNPPVSIPAADQGLLGRAVDAEYRRRRARVAGLLAPELQERRHRGSAGGPGVLDMLLAREPGVDVDRLLDELLAVLMAAQEPMAAALAWVALCACRAEGVQERLAGEGMESPYGRAVVAESLRLHPSAIGILRRLSRPASFAGHELAPGTAVMVPIPLVQRDRRVLEDPDEFRPERHLGPAADPGDLIAFGAGSRSCIGQWLARSELSAALGALWEHVRLRPVPARAERMVLRATILVPQRSGLVTAREA